MEKSLMRTLRRFSKEHHTLTFRAHTSSGFISEVQSVTDTLTAVPLRGDFMLIELDRLVEGGCLKQLSKRSYQITHKGLHPVKVWLKAVCAFAFKSIFVPIAVSFVTTLITLLLNGVLTVW